jgi:hypothetical protein
VELEMRFWGAAMDGKPEKDRQRMLTLEEVFEPWELVGQSRRDCEPHRARLLLVFSRISLGAGCLSLIPCFGLIPAIFGFWLGIATRTMARRDLDMISAGDMDHQGYHETDKARSNSHAAVMLSVLGFLFSSPVLAISYFVFGENPFTFGGP